MSCGEYFDSGGDSIKQQQLTQESKVGGTVKSRVTGLSVKRFRPRSAERKRLSEIAVRVALGTHGRVLGMILFDVVKLVMPGVAVGLIITAALVRVNVPDMGIALSNVESLSFVAGAAIAILVAVLASLAPARRAASVQPMVAMRSD